MKKRWKIWLGTVLIFMLLILIALGQPRRLDWTQSFSLEDKNPFGCYVLFNSMGKVFQTEPMSVKEIPFSQSLKYDSTGYAYFFITDEFSADSVEIDSLLNFVEHGNTVFISAYKFSQLQNKLHFATSGSFYLKDSQGVNFSRAEYQVPKGYHYEVSTLYYHFSSFDSSTSEVLGYDSEGANFLKVKHGMGRFYLHSLPIVFTNYYILNKSTSDYPYKALSHFPEDVIIFWDEYHKPTRELAGSPIRFLLQQAPLAWAYYSCLALVLLFLVFYGRRRQRVIAVMEPVKNTTLEFINVLCKLYLYQGKHKKIAEKKILYFRDRLRGRFNIKTDELNEEIVRLTAEKTGTEELKVRETFRYIGYIEKKQKITAAELKELNDNLISIIK